MNIQHQFPSRFEEEKAEKNSQKIRNTSPLFAQTTSIEQVPSATHQFDDLALSSPQSSRSDLELERQTFIQSDAFKEGLKIVVHNLCCFWDNPLLDTQKNPTDILVFNKEKNNIEPYQSSESLPLEMEASNEAVKDFLLDQLTRFYGKEVTDFFYPERKREEPLTVAYVKNLQARIKEFQLAVLQSCKSDLTQYQSAALSHLNILKQAEAALLAFDTNSTLKSETKTWIAALEKQMGISQQAALLLLGSGIALGAALNVTSGGTLSFPLATLLHSSGVLSSMASGHSFSLMGSSLAAAATGAKTTTVGSLLTHTVNPIIEDTIIGGALGGTIGAVHGLIEYNQMEDRDLSIRYFRILAVPFYAGLGAAAGSGVGFAAGIIYHSVVNMASMAIPRSLFSSYAHAAAFASANS